MKSYFSQFGEVTRLRLSRNKKTGRSKHYAFLEFANDSVAEIVADTMNNYLLFGHILKCRVMKDLTAEQIERLFKGANKRFKVIPRAKLAKRDNDKPKTEEQWNKLVVREDERREKKKQQLKDLGIDYDFEVAKPVEASEAEAVAEEAPAPKAIKAAEEEPSKEDAAAADAITQAIKGAKKEKAKKEKAAPVKARKSKRVAAQSK
jgi:nucleolar protein 15